MMQLRILSKIVLSSVLLGSVYGSNILTNEQQKSIDLSNQKALSDAKKLKNDWINPITYTYSYQDNENSGYTKTSTIAINQPIFRSGGIYNAIKYADNIKNSSLVSIDLQKKTLVKQALNLAYTIKKTELQIAKQNLAIHNAAIDLKIKKESVMNGLLDTSFLNNAIITLNQQKAALLELQYAKKAAILNFKNLSSKDINTLELPKLSQIAQKDFEINNLEVQKSTIDVETQNNLQWMTQANYLPSVNVNYSKTYYHSDSGVFKDGDNNDIMGISVVVPLDIKTFDAIDSAKAQYLKAKNDLTILKQSEINFYKSQNLKVSMLDDKVNLTKENIASYTELLKQMTELSNAGIKTSDDVTILANSKKIEELNLDILEYEKQIELLEIYGKLNSAEI